MSGAQSSLVGRWYATGPADRPFDPADRDWTLHVVVADDHAIAGCVTVENAAGQRFPVPRDLAADISLPPPVMANHPHARRRRGTIPQTGALPEGPDAPDTAGVDENRRPDGGEGWGRTPVPRLLGGRPVLGAFAADADATRWTVLCNATEDGGVLLTGSWTPAAPAALQDAVAHRDAFKAVLAFETARAAAREGLTG